MIKNMLTRREESDTYLAAVSRNRWSETDQLMKATMLDESYDIYLFSS